MKHQPIDAAFAKWTTRRKSKTGYIVQCKKQLWGVEAPTKKEAEREARHYFVQYFYDGEYT